MYQGKQSFLVDKGADKKAKLYKNEGYKTRDKTLINQKRITIPEQHGIFISLWNTGFGESLLGGCLLSNDL